jgi:hypothetical protein
MPSDNAHYIQCAVAYSLDTLFTCASDQLTLLGGSTASAKHSTALSTATLSPQADASLTAAYAVNTTYTHTLFDLC